jgi:hypothetical protein
MTGPLSKQRAFREREPRRNHPATESGETRNVLAASPKHLLASAALALLA